MYLLKKIKLSSLLLSLIFLLPSTQSFLFSDQSPPPTNLEYSFFQTGIGSIDLKIVLKFTGNESGKSSLTLPSSWGPQVKLYEEIYDLNSSTCEILDTDQPHVKEIHYAPHNEVSIEYKVRLVDDKKLDFENRFKSFGSEDYFFATGNSLLIILDSSDTESHVSLNWEGLPASWNLANSYGVNQLKQDLFIQTSKLTDTTFCGGDFEILESNNLLNPIYIALRGDAIPSKKDFLRLVESIIQSQRDFWNDHSDPHYLITVLPIDRENSYSGVVLTNSFNLILGKMEGMLEILTDLISHEYFHNWNGKKISSSEPEGSMYWFSEGFTDYYSFKLNYQYGLLEKSEYVGKLNTLLGEYYSSPVLQKGNDGIKNHFWEDPSYRRLPYIRGCTLALYLDSIIKDRSSELYSLDNVMYDLHDLVQETKKPFSIKDFYNLCAKYLSSEDIELVKGIIENGDIVPLDENMLGSDYDIEWTDYFGFYLEKSLKQGVIQGVYNDNSANQAGLQNGMKIVDWSKNENIISVDVLFKSGETKLITYELESTGKIPQFINKSDSSYFNNVP